jgi:hypothetical protein
MEESKFSINVKDLSESEYIKIMDFARKISPSCVIEIKGINNPEKEKNYLHG